ncbi:MAG: hypothetical protein F6K03_05440 [Kamptonema sp. SIO4C4]|nr:hypothetical protein [Kamptonema sp. SIO4C4]
MEIIKSEAVMTEIALVWEAVVQCVWQAVSTIPDGEDGLVAIALLFGYAIVALGIGFGTGWLEVKLLCI